MITLLRVRCGCSKWTVVLEDATDSLGRASSLGWESFDPPRECIDNYKDVGVALVVRWKRSDVVYVKTLEWIVVGNAS